MSQNDSYLQLLEVLKRRGSLSGSLAKSVAGFMERWGVDSYRAVVETHTVEESRLADILADEFGLIRVTRLRSRPIDKDVLKYVTYAEAMASDILPYAIDHEGRLQVAIADPTRRVSIEKLQNSHSHPLVLHVAERSEIQVSIQRHYPLTMQLPLTMAGYNHGACK